MVTSQVGDDSGLLDGKEPVPGVGAPSSPSLLQLAFANPAKPGEAGIPAPAADQAAPQPVAEANPPGDEAAGQPDDGTTASQPAIGFDNDGYHLSFAEEFDDPAWAPGSTWNTTFKQWGGLRTLSGNGELQVYVDPGYKGSAAAPLGLDPFSVTEGVLSIEASRISAQDQPYLAGFKYTSGVLTSNYTQLYGYFEVGAKLPAGRGLWPAFWLVGDGDYGNHEIDVFEVLGQDPGRIYQTIHGPFGSEGTSHYGVDTSDGFHTYGLEWTPEDIVWYVDGTESFRQSNFSDVPMYVLLNLAVGGWAGKPNAATAFPAEMLVDYLRAYSADDEIRTVENPDGGLTIFGTNRSDVMTGGDGRDVFVGSAGADRMEGRGMVDAVSYAGSPGGVVVDLGTGLGHLAHAEGDRYTSIGTVLGSRFDDILVGNGRSNFLDGGGGNDTLEGGAGSDTFVIRNDGALTVVRDFSDGDLLDLGHLGLAGFSALSGHIVASGIRYRHRPRRRDRPPRARDPGQPRRLRLRLLLTVSAAPSAGGHAFRSFGHAFGGLWYAFEAGVTPRSEPGVSLSRTALRVDPPGRSPEGRGFGRGTRSAGGRRSWRRSARPDCGRGTRDCGKVTQPSRPPLPVSSQAGRGGLRLRSLARVVSLLVSLAIPATAGSTSVYDFFLRFHTQDTILQVAFATQALLASRSGHPALASCIETNFIKQGVGLLPAYEDFKARLYGTVDPARTPTDDEIFMTLVETCGASAAGPAAAGGGAGPPPVVRLDVGLRPEEAAAASETAFRAVADWATLMGDVSGATCIGHLLASGARPAGAALLDRTSPEGPEGVILDAVAASCPAAVRPGERTADQMAQAAADVARTRTKNATSPIAQMLPTALRVPDGRRIYCSEGDQNSCIFEDTSAVPPALVPEAIDAPEGGWPTFDMRVPPDPDVALLTAYRDAVNPDVQAALAADLPGPTDAERNAAYTRRLEVKQWDDWH